MGDFAEGRVALGAGVQALHLARQHIEQKRHRDEGEQVVYRRNARAFLRVVERRAQHEVRAVDQHLHGRHRLLRVEVPPEV